MIKTNKVKYYYNTDTDNNTYFFKNSELGFWFCQNIDKVRFGSHYDEGSRIEFISRNLQHIILCAENATPYLMDYCNSIYVLSILHQSLDAKSIIEYLQAPIDEEESYLEWAMNEIELDSKQLRTIEDTFELIDEFCEKFVPALKLEKLEMLSVVGNSEDNIKDGLLKIYEKYIAITEFVELHEEEDID